jgi:predicted tellurium resistance membrane protein TerC
MAVIVLCFFVLLFSDFVDLFRMRAMVVSTIVAYIVRAFLLFVLSCLCFWFAVVVVLLLM